MQIDRTRFLLLTTAIAAGNAACNPGEAPPPSVAVSNEPPDAGVSPSAEGVPAATASPTSEGRVGPTSEGRHGPSSEGRGGPTSEGQVGASPYASASASGSANAPPPPGCPDSDNMVGTVGNCGTLRAPGPQCESFADTKADCSRYARGFKPRSAQRAVDCLLSKSNTQLICDFSVGGACAAAAAEASCIDPAVGPTCDTIMSNCGSGRRRGRSQLTKSSCMHALSALTGANRSKVATCITESCGVEYCFYDLH